MISSLKYLKIADNSLVPNLEALGNLTYISSSLQIFSNSNMYELKGVENIYYIGGSLKVSRIPYISKFGENIFKNLIFIGGHINIPSTYCWNWLGFSSTDGCHLTDPCIDNPCASKSCIISSRLNTICISGKCSGSIHDYSCESCFPNHYGKQCLSCNCGIGGECFDGSTSNGTCKCYHQYFGKQCNNTCPNCNEVEKGGFCNDEGVCICQNGYSGVYCQIPPQSSTSGSVLSTIVDDSTLIYSSDELEEVQEDEIDDYNVSVNGGKLELPRGNYTEVYLNDTNASIRGTDTEIVDLVLMLSDIDIEDSEVVIVNNFELEHSSVDISNSNVKIYGNFITSNSDISIFDDSTVSIEGCLIVVDKTVIRVDATRNNQQIISYGCLIGDKSNISFVYSNLITSCDGDGSVNEQAISVMFHCSYKVEWWVIVAVVGSIVLVFSILVGIYIKYRNTNLENKNLMKVKQQNQQALESMSKLKNEIQQVENQVAGLEELITQNELHL
eukprot:TRINITY_DN3912_c0_g1_i1.p1 TRINITY_DN3912_c0_g1~~TRINITY_DN3912_c0_g1_i1.p1  ORF type:complete len:500 (-),score=79.12 TRINITY_DN3912_c0_g1_i1:41-1540(-)